MFSNSRKLAQQTAQRLLSGHITLIAWWTIRNAGVIDAILAIEAESNDGLDLLVHATRKSLASDILRDLLEYLQSAGLVTLEENKVRLTAEGRALREHEDGLLELVRSYEPMLEAVDHLLAKLKTTVAAPRKTETLADAQARRYAAEVFPAVADVLSHHRFSNLLDVNCGAGDLLLHLAHERKSVIGVGISPDGALTRRANAAINAARLEKRLIAVPANPLEVCTNTAATFDRIGISRQLWTDLDCLLAINLFSDAPARDAENRATLPAVTRTLSALPRNFPGCHFLLLEMTDSPRFQKNFYAPELALLTRLAKAPLWTPEQWHDAFSQSNLTLLNETQLSTDGLTLFLLKPAN